MIAEAEEVAAARAVAARRAAGRAARESRSRLVAYLAQRMGDVVAAEDAVAFAFEKACALWPDSGAPDKPEAWLLTVARRALWKERRDLARAAAAAPELLRAFEAAEAAAVDAAAGEGGFPDARLGLLVACARPEIAEEIRAPLMLQVVLGLTAARIGSAFLTPAATMGQRLSRAKAQIAALGLRFEPPVREALEPALAPVLQAIYAAFGAGWAEDAAAVDRPGAGLAEEALELGRLVAQLAPSSAEAKGLLALMLFAESRRGARFGADGRYTPLDAQDVALWDRAMIQDASAALHAANAEAGTGRFQLEAAIQALHASRAEGVAADPTLITRIYEALLVVAPSVGAEISYAAALGRAGEPAAGLARLDALSSARVAAHQPYWAVRAHLLDAVGRPAATAYDHAIGLTEDPRVRAFLLARKAMTA